MAQVNNRSLKVKDIYKSYRKHRAVNGISIEINQGEIVGLLGPNGAGKTTTFNIITGLVKPDEGTVRLDETDITEMPMYQRARHGLGYLTQESSVFRKLTVAENIMAILEMMPLSRQQRQDRLKDLLQELSITHLADKKAHSISGGERRRVEVTRALVTNPAFLLLDEPFTGIDPIARADIQQVVVKLKERGIGVLLTDHNVRETLEITDRAYVIYEGQVFASGTPQEIVDHAGAREKFLGDKFTL
ncbi:MAG: LPS export ABC transporter ATP-binding protein [Candidatus Edwardsbacteria bacterium RIFOXYD12_FULL_50_11]|uniref:LPS export ABC transporter ATP-binding protein n=1 Tax=Candidatus Edwardsbacteria bacterium GWF2_54_11 TaxID=1817851 RepID=A0A1F5R132_9BACT|nr:MAG: LPS export ABC transporter ATP-binding protein [Candidatus Edwardsbacteria bacterium RifOxyC12_full_54_24]OGF07886.1 MAG: LPS export ABC transporter ATP-binding protein [Candidatus Edwardsbacteria bacterium RifOxyA12_full_54_48]OGF08157.1 MAG: LPS export ABC transporter ATP-binding protein [Candidatus Edwardsbacteria bacterium GWF2_54_11]OGF10134.1 MAG: LPS export ABC transporter ATP-binding protein [Candidatus Edwardsbacteria bacterium GWE2_54_12]OGF15046.1 MAG: LPS export ABC transpor